MTLPIRPYWPTLANMVHRMCIFITRHQTVLIAVLRTVDPADESAVIAAFTALNSACTLFLNVMHDVDPNWKPS